MEIVDEIFQIGQLALAAGNDPRLGQGSG